MGISAASARVGKVALRKYSPITVLRVLWVLRGYMLCTASTLIKRNLKGTLV